MLKINEGMILAVKCFASSIKSNFSNSNNNNSNDLIDFVNYLSDNRAHQLAISVLSSFGSLCDISSYLPDLLVLLSQKVLNWRINDIPLTLAYMLPLDSEKGYKLYEKSIENIDLDFKYLYITLFIIL